MTKTIPPKVQKIRFFFALSSIEKTKRGRLLGRPRSSTQMI